MVDMKSFKEAPLMARHSTDLLVLGQIFPLHLILTVSSPPSISICNSWTLKYDGQVPTKSSAEYGHVETSFDDNICSLTCSWRTIWSSMPYDAHELTKSLFNAHCTRWRVDHSNYCWLTRRNNANTLLRPSFFLLATNQLGPKKLPWVSQLFGPALCWMPTYYGWIELSLTKFLRIGFLSTSSNVNFVIEDICPVITPLLGSRFRNCCRLLLLLVLLFSFLESIHVGLQNSRISHLKSMMIFQCQLQ